MIIYFTHCSALLTTVFSSMLQIIWKENLFLSESEKVQFNYAKALCIAVIVGDDVSVNFIIMKIKML